MNCAHCQRDIADYSNFCYCCGAPQRVAPGNFSRSGKQLRRSIADKKIAGVCGGIAEYFDIDSSIVRLGWLLAVVLPIPFVPAFLGYFVAWIVMPKPQTSTVCIPAPPASTAPFSQTV
jgi:phage shock protein C